MPPAAFAVVDADDALPATAAAKSVAPASIEITPSAATGVLATGAVLLVVAHIVAVGFGPGSDIDSATGLGRVLHLNGERNAPALFSTALLLLAALCFALWARAAIAGPGGRRMWRLLAVLFVFLAVDEYFSVHERLSAPLRALFDLHGTVLHYAWIVPYALGVAVLAALFLPIYLRLPRRLQVRLGLAAALYLGGVFGMQGVGALMLGTDGEDSTGYAIASTVEEALELAGLVLLIDTQLRHLATLPHGARLQLAPEPRR